MNNSLIVLEQLPKIKYQLEQLSVEIKEKVDRVNNLIVNEDTVKETKKLRADLNKEFNELETQRKQVKQAIMNKYDEFEEIYKECVSNLYKDADVQLKEKIDNVENELRKEKEDELREFFKQHCIEKGIDGWFSFESFNYPITLSASMKSLKEEVLNSLNNIEQALKLIELEEFKDEILLEYKENRDFSKSKLDVIERHKKLEEIARQQEQKEQVIEQDQKQEEKVAEIIAPKEIIENEDILEVTFTLKAPKEKILKVKELIEELGIEYE